MELRFRITFKQGPVTVAVIENISHVVDVKADDAKRILETEAFLEHLTGLRVHIDQQ